MKWHSVDGHSDAKDKVVVVNDHYSWKYFGFKKKKPEYRKLLKEFSKMWGQIKTPEDYMQKGDQNIFIYTDD